MITHLLRVVAGDSPVQILVDSGCARLVGLLGARPRRPGLAALEGLEQEWDVITRQLAPRLLVRRVITRLQQT